MLHEALVMLQSLLRLPGEFSAGIETSQHGLTEKILESSKSINCTLRVRTNLDDNELFLRVNLAFHDPYITQALVLPQPPWLERISYLQLTEELARRQIG